MSAPIRPRDTGGQSRSTSVRQGSWSPDGGLMRNLDYPALGVSVNARGALLPFNSKVRSITDLDRVANEPGRGRY